MPTEAPDQLLKASRMVYHQLTHVQMVMKLTELIPGANEMLNLLAIRGIDEEISEVILWVPNWV
jgi:hypothetical protein